MISEFEKQAIVVALSKMFQGNYFDICVVDACLKITRAIPPQREYNALRPLHCVEWAQMGPGLRDQVFIKTLELFAHEGFRIEQITAPPVVGRTKQIAS